MEPRRAQAHAAAIGLLNAARVFFAENAFAALAKIFENTPLTPVGDLCYTTNSISAWITVTVFLLSFCPSLGTRLRLKVGQETGLEPATLRITI